MKTRFSLTKKIGILISSSFIVSIAVLAISLTVIFQENINKEFSERIIAIGENLSSVISGPLNTVISMSAEFTPEIIKTLNNPCQIAIEREDIFYAVLLRTGAQITTANKFSQAEFILPEKKETNKLLNGKYNIYEVEIMRQKLNEIRIPVVKADKTIGEIALGYSTKEINQLLKKVILLTIIISLILLCLTMGASFVFLRKDVAYPINILLTEARIGATGDLSQEKIEITSNDEIGELGSIFNEMFQGLNSMVCRIRDLAEKVSSSAEQLSSSSEVVNSSTQQVSDVVANMNKRTTLQAELVRDVVEIIEKTSAALRQMVTNAQSANVTVTQTSNQTEESKLAAREGADNISKLADTIIETAKVIQGLGEKSQQIGEIVETITSIADQTNLLALNAAIEAARAGEAGRGFAVVAEEVRKLAEGSAQAVSRIAGLIRSIQAEIDKAVTSIVASAKGMQEGNIKVSKILDILGRTDKAIKDVAVLVEEIGADGQSQNKEIERVVKTVGEVAIIARDSVSTSEEITSLIEEHTASMEQMSASTHELARIAVDLKDLVGEFKLKEEKVDGKEKKA